MTITEEYQRPKLTDPAEHRIRHGSQSAVLLQLNIDLEHVNVRVPVLPHHALKREEVIVVRSSQAKGMKVDIGAVAPLDRRARGMIIGVNLTVREAGEQLVLEIEIRVGPNGVDDTGMRGPVQVVDWVADPLHAMQGRIHCMRGKGGGRDAPAHPSGRAPILRRAGGVPHTKGLPRKDVHICWCVAHPPTIPVPVLHRQSHPKC